MTKQINLKGKQMKPEELTAEQLDTFDTLKYGYIPVKHLFEYASEKLDMPNLIDDFMNDDEYNPYTYTRYVPLLWDGDSYDFGMTITSPEIDPDENDCVSVLFHFDLDILAEEKRNMPNVNNINEYIDINSREQFVDAILKWKTFLGEVYIEILRNRLDILNDLDNIASNDRLILPGSNSEKEIKKQYEYWLMLLPLKLADNVESATLFQDNRSCF